MTRGRIALRPGAESFEVDELLAYAPCGEGEHLYVRVEKRDLTTDRLADALARCTRRPRKAVGFAGRKDRHAVARQWVSIQGAREEDLRELSEHTGGRATVLEIGRHRNKLRLGHLRGNRFRLALDAGDGDGATARAQLEAGLADLVHNGLLHRFGAQRFGRAGSTLHIARALARDEPWEAVRWWVDARGRWKPGDPVPEARAGGVEARVRAAVRRSPDDPRPALRAAGRELHKLAASAAQSAVFNAILDARRHLGLLHRIRPGDVVRKLGAGAFVCSEADVDDVNRRAAPGRLEVVATGPLPGTSRLLPSPDVLAEERAWSRDADVDWEWFARGGALESPGERRSLVVQLLETPSCVAGPDGALVLDVGLPRGSYATELLVELGVELPAERSGSSASAILGA